MPIPAHLLIPRADHFYTTSAAEKDSAVANHGYEPEGVACYVHTSQASGTTPFYRLMHDKLKRED